MVCLQLSVIVQVSGQKGKQKIAGPYVFRYRFWHRAIHKSYWTDIYVGDQNAFYAMIAVTGSVITA
jgi:hypothetical protein